MDSSKRRLLRLSLAAAVVPVQAICAAAEPAYPTKPIRLIVGFAPGGPTDQVARVVAEGLSKRLLQPVIVENRSGGNLIPATVYVAKAPPDGYTLHLTNGQPFTLNLATYTTLPYGPNDYTAIAQVSESPMGLFVRSNSRFRTLGELVSYAKANPGALNAGAPGSMSESVLELEMFNALAGIDIKQIPYAGMAPVILSLLQGTVDLVFCDFFNALPHIQAGAIRVLAVAQQKRVPFLPDVPTFAEAGYPTFSIPPIFNGLLGPPGMSHALVEQLNAAVTSVVASPEFKKYCAESTFLPITGRPEMLVGHIREGYAAYLPIVKRLGLKIN